MRAAGEIRDRILSLGEELGVALSFRTGVHSDRDLLEALRVIRVEALRPLEHHGEHLTRKHREEWPEHRHAGPGRLEANARRRAGDEGCPSGGSILYLRASGSRVFYVGADSEQLAATAMRALP